MRTTLDLNESLIEKAQELTQIKEKTSLIHEALRVLISQAAQVELTKLKGSQKQLRAPRRRRQK